MAVMAVNAACSQYRPVPAFDPGEAREPVPVPGTPLVLRWRSKPLRGPSQPLSADSVSLYLGGSDRRLVAVDLASGRTRWAVRFGGPLVGGVLRDGDRVFAATDQPEGRVHALQVASGSQVWQVSTGYVHVPLTLAGEHLIVLTRSGWIYAIRKHTGEVAWHRRLPSSRIPALPLDGERLLVTSFDSLFVVQVADGRVTRRVPAPGPVTAPWQRAGAGLIGVTGDSTLIVLEPEALAVLGRVRLDSPVLTTPALWGDTLYCVTQMGTVWQIQLEPPFPAQRLAELRWPAVGTPVVLGGWLLVGGADGVLRALDRASGAEAWRLQLGRPAEAAPLVLGDGSFIALGGRGDLQRLQP
jgi:outer membrane protein assembly factor BamB